MNRHAAARPGNSARLSVYGAVISLVAALLALPPDAGPRPAQGRPAPLRPAESLAASSEGAYFLFDYPPYPETFIFQLIDPATLREARAILSGWQPNRHIMGMIVKAPAGYNPPWSYYLDPASITFFDFAVEQCDASIQYVEAHLDQACGALLPGCTWCPWGSRLIAEVTIDATPTPTTTTTPTLTTTPTFTPTPTTTPTQTPASTPTAEIHLPVVLR